MFKSFKQYLLITTAILASYVLVILAVWFATRYVPNPSTKNVEVTPGNSFSFAAVGDWGATPNTSANLSLLETNKPNFTIALGDLSYGNIQPESAWCDLVTQYVGTEYPFELLAGNHDDDHGQGHINKFKACLPNQLDATIGDYAIQYSFDYAELARFILISPDLIIDGHEYNYQEGQPEYRWLLDQINEAKAQNLWTVVAMHKNCITIGNKPCEITPELLNLLVAKSVDLVLQGHEHNYQRSKQLKYQDGCETIQPNSYNPACVAMQVNENVYPSGSGPVIVINGAGGYSRLYDVNTTDPEVGYFLRWQGANVQPSYGLSYFKVSKNRIQATFEPSLGDFHDSFVIVR